MPANDGRRGKSTSNFSNVVISFGTRTQKIPARKAALAPFGESSMWGDYHAMELAVYLQREIDGERPYLTFFGPFR